MPLIDNTYFYTGVTRIAQILDTKVGVGTTVASYIALYEPEFLSKLMGYALYTAFTDEPTEERFVNLLDGGTYINLRGYTEQYKGLKWIIGTDKYSPIANYVYWCYLRDTAVQLGGVGTAITGTENATRVSPISKQRIAWNQMVDWVYSFEGYMHANAEIYPEYHCRDTDYSLRHKQNDLNL